MGSVPWTQEPKRILGSPTCSVQDSLVTVREIMKELDTGVSWWTYKSGGIRTSILKHSPRLSHVYITKFVNYLSRTLSTPSYLRGFLSSVYQNWFFLFYIPDGMVYNFV